MASERGGFARDHIFESAKEQYLFTVKGISRGRKVTCQKSCSGGLQVFVDSGQNVGHCHLRAVVFLQQHHLELVVQVFNLLFDVLVRNEEVVASGHVLHDVSLDLFVLEDGDTAVDQDRRLRGLEVRPEVDWRSLHVDRCHLKTKNV